MLMMTKIALYGDIKTAGPFGNVVRNAASTVRNWARSAPAVSPAAGAAAAAAPTPRVIPSNDPAIGRPTGLAIPEAGSVVGQPGFMGRVKGIFQGPEQRAANATARAHQEATKQETLANLTQHRGDLLRQGADARASVAAVPKTKAEADIEALHGQAATRPGALGWLGRHGKLITPGTGAVIGAGLSMGKDLITGNPDEDGKDQGVSITKALGAAGAGAGLGMLGRMGARSYMRHGIAQPAPAPTAG